MTKAEILSSILATVQYTGKDSSDVTRIRETLTEVATALRPYKIYTATLTQSSTAAPTAEVLENTLGGTLVWTRSGAGTYVGTLANAFSLTKTSAIAASFGSATNSFDMDLGLSVNAVTLGSYDAAGSPADGKLTKTLVEIRVYE